MLFHFREQPFVRGEIAFSDWYGQESLAVFSGKIVTGG